MNTTAKPYTPGLRRPLASNLWQGLRALFLLRVDRSKIHATWTQLVLLVLLQVLVQFAYDFANVGVKGMPVPGGLPGVLFIVPVVLFAAWGIACILDGREWVLWLAVLFAAIYFPLSVLGHLLSTPAIGWWERYWLASALPPIWLGLAASVAAVRLMPASRRRCAVAGVFGVVAFCVPLGLSYNFANLWMAPFDPETAMQEWNRRDILDTEEVFYLQPRLLAEEVDALKPGGGNRITMFFVGVAGYADQDVFMKEVRFVRRLFEEKYGATGHSAILVNNPRSASTTPIASDTALRRVLDRIGELMDKDRDILFLYLSSHGSKDHKFSLEFGSMRFQDLDPERLRSMLDRSGIKRRVVVISACYSGGFIDSMKSEDTLVITAAAADRQSFGCTNEADFTYFGQAYFRDALAGTRSFTEAFEIAKPAIAEREAKTEYVHSDPQMYIGSRIQAALDDFERQPPLEPANVAGVPASAERLQLAREFIRAYGIETQVRMTRELCEKNSKNPSPESMLQDNPDYFGGLRPSSPQWPQVLAAYDDFYRAICLHPVPGDMLDTMARIYASGLTSAELRRMIAFQATSDGRKLTASNQKIYLALDEFVANAHAAEVPKASAKLSRDLQEAIRAGSPR
jgi:hypothetical protein